MNSQQNKGWTQFMSAIKTGSPESAYPRKAVHLDADLQKTIRELNFFGETEDNDPNTVDVMNAMVRAFIHAYYDELKQFRKKIEAKSLFEQ